ncbi:MAG: hypothetical protein ABII23_09405 [bacterium]
MKKLFLQTGAGIILILSLLWVSVRISKIFPFPFPSFTVFPQHEDYLVDLSGIMLGMRRIAADIAWVQLSQYYARPQVSKEEALEVEYKKFINKVIPYKHDFNERVGYPEIYERTLRIINLDPFFKYAYLYSAGALAWNLDRYDEAYDILKRGLAMNPLYWRFSMYVGAISYKEKGQHDKMVGYLEEIIIYPDCPNLIRSILANYYRKEGQYYKSLKVWIYILDTGDESYMRRARSQIEEIRSILNLQ